MIKPVDPACVVVPIWHVCLRSERHFGAQASAAGVLTGVGSIFTVLVIAISWIRAGSPLPFRVHEATQCTTSPLEVNEAYATDILSAWCRT